MNIVYARQPLPPLVDGKVPNSMFLFGPTPREENIPSWRPRALDFLRQARFNGVVFVPENEEWGLDKVIYEEQTRWEITAAGISKVRVVWIPRELAHMPAFTTNTEYGFVIAFDPGSVVLGCPMGAVKVAYQKQLARDIMLLHAAFEADIVRRYGQAAPLPEPIHTFETLEETLFKAVEIAAA